MRKKVLLVDDHPAMLWALKNMLAQQVHFEIIGDPSTFGISISKMIRT